MAFQKAKRQKIYPKIALIGASGSGKSYSALRLATGYIKKLGGDYEIYYIDSEGGRGKYYANEFDYNYTEISDPYTPEKYVEAINEAIETGNCGVLIIDSITHEWSGKGGLLEQHNNMAGNSYTNWAKLTPRHNNFVDTILLSPVCVISTVRGKDEYVLEEKNGKQTPKKVGMGGETRQNFEYEMTMAFNIDQSNHVATASKDNTKLFDNIYNVLTEKDGAAIYDWANSGDSAPEVKPMPKQAIKEEKKEFDINTATLDEIKPILLEMCKTKAANKRPAVNEVMKNVKSMNPNNIADVEMAKAIYTELYKI
jgi:uncharacterized protein (UPF0297 family)